MDECDLSGGALLTKGLPICVDAGEMGTFKLVEIGEIK